jgi:hypothetical protein
MTVMTRHSGRLHILISLAYIFANCILNIPTQAGRANNHRAQEVGQPQSLCWKRAYEVSIQH